MYYIINQANHIIAADKELLELLSVNTIGELHQNIALNSISLEISNDNALNISTLVDSTSYGITSHTLISVLGDMTLIVIQEATIESDENDLESFTTDENDFSLIDEEPITFNDSPVTTPEEKPEEDLISPLEDNDKPFDLITEEEPFLLDEFETDEETHPEEDQQEVIASITETETEDTTPIVINVSEVSQMIGISEEDYNAFLNEYIDTALTLEEDLKSTQSQKRSHAVTTLSHLSNVLHLPVISQIMADIERSDEDTQNHFIRSFFDTLARLTTSTQGSSDSQETEKENIAEVPESETSSETPNSAISSIESFGTIDLSDVKPIHFDFQLEEAASDLSLPVELIEEFVVDFIDQAHVETENMLRAYENGDLETIQKIGHLLKGTSSNLRINPLADTLYKIQFCEDSSQLEDLIKEYWAHFLSFEHQINIISK